MNSEMRELAAVVSRVRSDIQFTNLQRRTGAPGALWAASFINNDKYDHLFIKCPHLQRHSYGLEAQ